MIGGMSDRISPTEFQDAPGTADWRVVGDGARTFFPTPSLDVAARLVAAVAAIPGIERHRPDVDVRAGGVAFRLLTRERDYYGMSRRDVEIAAAVSAASRELGLAADPAAVASFLVIPGAGDVAAIMPAWRAALGYVPRPDSPDEDLVDPHDLLPDFWFERMRDLRADGQGSIHVAIWLPFDQAEARVKAALAAGARLVRDEFAPSWWTLADPAGNEFDIATVKGRD